MFTNSLADFRQPAAALGQFPRASVESYIEVTGMNRLGNGAALRSCCSCRRLPRSSRSAWVAKVLRRRHRQAFGSLSDLASKPTRLVPARIRRAHQPVHRVAHGTIVAGCFVKNWGIDYTFTTANIVEGICSAAGTR